MVKSGYDWFEQGNEIWAKAQQDYWNQWSGWVKKSGDMGNPFPIFNQTQSDFERWPYSFVPLFNQWQQFFQQQPAPDVMKDFMYRMTEMGKNYCEMSQSLYQASSVADGSEKMIAGWLDAMQTGFKECKQRLESGFNVDLPWIMGTSGMTVQAWQKVADSMLSALNQPTVGQQSGLEFPSFFADMFPETDKTREQLMKMLGMPALGYSRERQEKIQKLAERLVIYGRALKAYKMAFVKNGLASVKALRSRLSKLDKPIESMRAFYDFWVEVNEDVYSKFAMGDEYQVVYGDLVNSLVAVQQLTGELAEDIYKLMHLPTRTEMDSLTRSLQQGRRENRQLRKQLTVLSKRMDELDESRMVKQKTAASKAASKSVSGKQAGNNVMDDLTRIKGIGPKMQEQLYTQGVTAFTQLAGLSKKATAELEENINAAGRIARQQWIKQAKELLGGE